MDYSHHSKVQEPIIITPSKRILKGQIWGCTEIRGGYTLPASKSVKNNSRRGFEQISDELIKTGKEFYSRGWLFGTSGNLSAVFRKKPLQIAITASGMDKGSLSESQILKVDAKLKVLAGNHKPSAESELHLAVVRGKGAGAVFHTHSAWSTALSDIYAKQGGIAIRGYEMLKGLSGVKSHEHTEWIPIFENSQDMKWLSAEVSDLLSNRPEVHGFLLRGHGMYTWGADIQEARRHTEVLEFLLDVVGRTQAGRNS